MNYKYIKPNESLEKYVRTILVIEDSGDYESESLPVFTNGMETILYRSEKDESGNNNILQLTLYGKSIPPECWTINNNNTIIAYFFKPFALTSLFKISIKELIDNQVDLIKLSQTKTIALKTQLVYADSIHKKIDVIDNLLILLLKENHNIYEIIRYATDKIMLNPTKIVLSEIMEELKINERTFQRIFKKYVGVTPTQYRRICQFHISFEQLREKQFDKISDIAFDNGFSDQSHFIRSFKEFTQITPNDYLIKGLLGKN